MAFIQLNSECDVPVLDCNLNTTEIIIAATIEPQVEVEPVHINPYLDLDNLEEDKELALEYIQNDLANMDQDKGMSNKTDKPELPNGMEYEDATNPTIHICEHCKGIYASDYLYNSHECHNTPKMTKTYSYDETIPDSILTKKYADISQADIDKLLTEENPDKTPKIIKKQLICRRNPPPPKPPPEDNPNDDKTKNSKYKGPHTCKVCHKTLCRRASLLIHMRRHTGETRFECDLCQKKFVVLYDLDRHMLTHVGTKKYSYCCDVCLKPFVTESGMFQHKTLHHKVLTMHSCEVCGQIFSTKAKLSRHTLDHKPAKIPEKTVDPLNPVLLIYTDKKGTVNYL